MTGVAGSGQTRLALAVAQALCEAYHDGALLVELSTLPTLGSSRGGTYRTRW
jgi:gluconate kinase